MTTGAMDYFDMNETVDTTSSPYQAVENVVSTARDRVTPYPSDESSTFDPNLKCIRKYFNNQTQTYYIYKGYSGIPENLTFAFIIWVITIIIFILIRRYTLGRHRVVNSRDEAEGPPNTCRTVLAKYFGWIPFIIKLGDQQISGKCGPDAFLYLVFQRYLIVYMAIVCFVSVVIVLPVNYHGNLVTVTEQIRQYQFFILFYWALQVSLCYLVLALVFMSRLKKLYLAARTDEIKTRTLILTNLPAGTNLEKGLVEYFRESYQETFVESFNQAYNVRKLSAIFAERQKMHDLKLDCEETYSLTGDRQLMWRHSCGFCSPCCGCKQVDAIDYYTDRESRLTTEYQTLLTRVLSNPLDIAFVTFTTESMAKRVCSVLSHPIKYKDRFIRYCTSCCSQRKGGADIRRCGVYHAVEPEDIYWENMAQSRLWWWIKAFLVNTILFILLFVATTPSVIMNRLDEWRYLDTLHKLNSPGLTSIMPVLILWIFSALLPMAVYMTEGLIGHWTRSNEQKVITIKTFVFLLLMILILPSLGLTSAKSLIEWLTDKNQPTIRWTCIFLPDNGAFFVNYLITACFIGTSVKLLRVWDLICLGFRLLVARCTAERDFAWKTLTCNYFRYGVEYAWILVLFCTIVSYSVSVPLITPIGLLYLLLKHFVDRHNIYYAYKTTSMSSEPHHRAINFVYTAVILLQCNVVAFILLRSEGMPPPPAYFSLTVLVGALAYLLSRSIMACARRAMSVFVTIQDAETGLSPDKRLIYLPEVVLWGSTPENLRKSVAPRVTENDL